MTANPLSTIPPIGPASGMPAAQRSSKFKPVDPLKLLRGHWLLLTLTAVVGVIVGVAVCWVWSHEPLPGFVPDSVNRKVEATVAPVRKHLDPQYTSRARLQVDAPVTDPLNPNAGAMDTQDRGLSTIMATTAVQITSPAVLDRAVDRIVALHNTNPKPAGFEPIRWFVEEHRGSPTSAKTALKDNMVVARPKTGTRLVEIEVSTRHEEDAALILRAIVDVYVGMLRAEREATGLSVGDTWSQTGGQLERQKSDLDKRMARFLRMHGDVPVLNNSINAAEFQYTARLKQLEELEVMIAEAEQYLAGLNRPAPAPAGVEGEAAGGAADAAADEPAGPDAADADADAAAAEAADGAAAAEGDDAGMGEDDVEPAEPLQGAGEGDAAAVAGVLASSAWERDLALAAQANGLPVPTQTDLTEMRTNYPEISNDIMRLERLEDDIALAIRTRGPNNRMTRDLIQQEEEIRSSLVRNILIKRQVLTNERRRAAENQIELLMKRKRVLEDELNQLDEKRSLLKQRLSEWQGYEEERRRLNARLDEIRTAEFKARLLTGRPDIDQITVVQPPTEAEMTWPKWQVLVPGMTIGFLAVVAGLLFVREMLDQRVRSPGDVGLIADADLLGMLPDSKEDPSGMTAVGRVVERQPTGLLAESYRQVRTAVLSRMDRRGYKTLAITSAQADAGTSTVAHNLATSFAMNNRQVLLVDANLRRPSQHEVYGIDGSKGFVQVLRGEAELHECVHELEGVGLSVLPAGDIRDATPELLECSMLRTLLGRLETRYDLVILDTAPVLLMADCQLLTKTVDAIAVVVKAGRDKRGMLSRTLRQLDGQRADVLGTILSGVRTSVGGYFRKSYQQFYRYGEASTRKSGDRPLASARTRAAAPAAAAAETNGGGYGGFDSEPDRGEAFRFDDETDDQPGYGETNGHGGFDDDDTERRG